MKITLPRPLADSWCNEHNNNQVLKGYLALFQTSQANHQLSCLWDIVFSQKLHQVETVLMEYESGAHPACIRSGGRDTTLGSLLFSSYARAHSNGLGVQQETVKAAGVCMGRGIRADAACESQTSSCGSGDSNSGLAIRGGLSEDDLMDVDCEECRGPAADQGSCPQTDDDGAREQQPSQASPSFSKYGVVGVSTGDQYGQTLPEETNETGKEPEVSTGTTGLTGDGYSRARTSTPRATMGVDKSTPAASTCPADDEGNQDGQASSEPSMSEVLQDHTSRSPATDTIGADDSVHTPGTVCTVSIPGGSNNRRVSTRIRMRKRQDTSPGPAGGACSGGGSTGKGATKSDKQSGAGRRETRSQRKRPVGTKATLSRDSCAKSQQNAGPEHTLPAFPFDISINTLKGEVDQLAYRVFTRLCSAMIRNKDGRAITTGAISKDQAFEYTRTVLMEFIGGVPERIKRIQDEAYKHRHLSIATKPDGDTTLDSIKARVRSVILSDLSFDKGLKGLEYFLNVFRLAEHIQEIESRLGKPGGLLDPVDQTKLRYTAETSPEDLTYAVADFVLNSGHYPGGSYPRCHLDNLKIVLEFYKWGRGAALFIPIQCRRL